MSAYVAHLIYPFSHPYSQRKNSLYFYLSTLSTFNKHRFSFTNSCLSKVKQGVQIKRPSLRGVSKVREPGCMVNEQIKSLFNTCVLDALS